MALRDLHAADFVAVNYAPMQNVNALERVTVPLSVPASPTRCTAKPSPSPGNSGTTAWTAA